MVISSSNMNAAVHTSTNVHRCRDDIPGTSAICLTTPNGGRCPGRHSVLGWQGGGVKVGVQLGDALGLVVMHPVRGAGQALDAVEAGHVVVVALGAVGA